MKELNLSLPDRLAQEAQAAGLLTPQALEAMLRDALREKHRNELAKAMDTLTDTDIPPMTLEEIDAEIQAYRNERRRAAGP